MSCISEQYDQRGFVRFSASKTVCLSPLLFQWALNMLIILVYLNQKNISSEPCYVWNSVFYAYSFCLPGEQNIKMQITEWTGEWRFNAGSRDREGEIEGENKRERAREREEARARGTHMVTAPLCSRLCVLCVLCCVLCATVRSHSYLENGGNLRTKGTCSHQKSQIL